jgi:CubicO group peptidase (beta-lactamase class C family)
VGCAPQDRETKPVVNGLVDGELTKDQTDSIFTYTRGFPVKTQFAIAILRDGEVRYYGTHRLGDTITTVDNQDRAFEIGSITKVFTTTVLAHYVKAGELDLDGTINPYFDFPFKDDQSFTFRMLANHTSGLPRLPSNIRFNAILNPRNPYKNYDERKLDAYLQDDLSLAYPQGSKSDYSNLGMGLLSYTLRRYTGRDFDQLTRTLIFDPLGMKNSTADKSTIADILVAGLDDKGRPTPNWAPGALIGAGGIYSTVGDLAKFALAQFDTTHHALALTREKTFKETETRDVGLGWFILNRKDGSKWHWHNGGTGGYTSSMAIDVDRRNGVILLSNISSYHQDFANVDKLCFALMKTLYGEHGG